MRHKRFPSVLILLFVIVLSSAAHAAGGTVSDFEKVLFSDGIAGLALAISKNEVSFPPEESLRKDLANVFLTKLDRHQKKVRRAEADSFSNSANELSQLSSAMANQESYTYLMLAEATHGALIDALLERLIVTSDLPNSTGPVVNGLKDVPVSSCGKFMNSLSKEMLSEFQEASVKNGTIEDCLSSFSAQKESKVENSSRSRQTLSDGDLSGFASMVLRNRFNRTMLFGFLEMFAQNGNLPGEKEDFLIVAGEISFVKEPPHSGGRAYKPEEFWEVYSKLKHSN